MPRFYTLLICVSFLFSCQKDQLSPQLVPANFLGRHTYLCHCCGGYQFEIEGAFYLAKKLPEDTPSNLFETDLSLNEAIPVRLAYKFDYECQAFQIIQIDKIENQ